MFPAATPIAPMAEKPSLDSVKDAIKQVLSHDQSVDRKAATDFLDSLKSSVFAWEICDQLLQAQEGIAVCYIAANMLRQKISRNFNELPLECYSSLKDSILNKLQTIDDYAVQGQLTMAIADLTLLLQAWNEPIEDLAKHLGLSIGLMSLTSTNYESLHKALNNRLIFGYILHQMCDLNHDHSERPFRIGARRREEYENYLVSRCSQVITWWLNTMNEVQELKQCIQASDQQAFPPGSPEAAIRAKCLETIDKLTGQIYLCYSAWLRIFDEENLNDSLPLIDAAFKHLSDINCPDMIHKYSAEVITSTANHCEDNRALDYLVNHLVSQIYALEPVLQEAVKTEDLEKSGSLTSVFTNVAVTACQTHVIEKQDFKLVELILSCMNHYDHEIVEETFTFWWIFLENLQNRLKATQYGPYIGYINRFVMAATKLCQFVSDEEQVVTRDSELLEFRQSAAELISDVLFITTVQDFIRDNNILDCLSWDLAKVSWEKVEAILYLVSCLAQMLTREDNNLKMQIFNCIIAQQTGNRDIQGLLASKQIAINIGVSPGQVHPQIVETSLKIISSLESFIAFHPDYRILAINYILSTISNEKYQTQLVKPAASALCSIMDMNANHLITSYPEVLTIIKSLCSDLDRFDENAANELLRCAALLAEAIKEPVIKDQFLCEVLAPIIGALQETLMPPKRDETEPTKYLDRLSSAFRQLSIHPSVVPELKNFVTLVDAQIWPIAVKVLEVYASEKGHAIERTCRTIRYLLRCIKPEWMIQRVAETMISLYKTYPQNSSPLYICSILVDEFANKSPEINQGLFAMLEIFCDLTFTLLNMDESQQTSLLTMKNYPETIDDMMRLFNRFLRKCPDDFVNCKALESIIGLSISSLRIDHQEANANVCKFLSSFITLAQQPEYPNIREAIRNVLGARITDAAISACLFDVPSILINEEVGVLMTLYSFDKSLFAKWVEASVDSLPRTNIQGIESVSQEQLNEFKTAITTAGTTKKMVNYLRSQARMYS